MRSLSEISFRLRQEALNLWLFVRPPALERIPTVAPLPLLPDPAPVLAAVANTPWADDLIAEADRILKHEFRLLGITIETGPDIEWRRDYLAGKGSESKYFRSLPYLDFDRVGDHKVIWELNRHQHLVALAQAWRLTLDVRYKDELFAQLESWWRDNPVQRGINWASALEVAFRALSWTWVYHLTAADMPEGFRGRFLTELYRHGLHLDANLSVYFSPNTHLLGEAVALHALGALCPFFPGASAWVERGARIIDDQMEFQVKPDGSHFEQSSYYHIYAVDFFVLHLLLHPVSSNYRAGVRRMAAYARSLLGPGWRIPLMGDDDGGRLFHPYGIRAEFGRATLATCSTIFEEPSWLRDPSDVTSIKPYGGLDRMCSHYKPAPVKVSSSTRYEDSGTACMEHENVQAIIDSGPFGWGGAGHSHSDTLSLVLRRGREEILVDSGTYTYLSDPKWRNWFRSSAAHNTIRINMRNEANFAGPFRWSSKPDVECLAWRASEKEDFLDAIARYGGFTHRRTVLFRKPDVFVIVDEVSGPDGPHDIEQFWHFGVAAERVSPLVVRAGSCELTFLQGETVELTCGGEHGWRSEALRSRKEAPVACCRRTAVTLPARFVTCINLSAHTRTLLPRVSGDGVELYDAESPNSMTPT